MDRFDSTPPTNKMPINEDVLEFLILLVEADMELQTSKLVNEVEE